MSTPTQTSCLESTSQLKLRLTVDCHGEAGRVVEYLDTAAGLFAEVGYEATTMTAIAERAGSSIGGLYRYFPDKPTLALALHRQYSQEVEGVWTPLFKEAKTLSAAEFAERLMARMADFA